MRELFERLRANGTVIAPASVAKKDELMHHKEAAHIEDLIQVETPSDGAEKSKPHPDIFEAVKKRLGDVRPEDIIVVGNRPYYAIAAAKVGLRTVGLLCDGWPEDELRRAGCVAVYKDPTDLLAQYETSPLADAGAKG